jgi:glycosyltransferase involved in cell wall biosynthesis
VRIAYVARCEAAAESGVLKKLAAQVRHWRKEGHDASLFLLSRSGTKWTGAADLIELVVTESGWPTRHTGMWKLCAAAYAWRPDVVYIRFETHYAGLTALMRKIPSVLELNTDDVSEYPQYLPRIQYLYHRMLRGGVLRRAAGLVAVTKEIGERFAEWGKPTVVIANGIDLASFSALPPPPVDKQGIAFVGAAGASWHGLDELITLAKAAPDIAFHVVGPSGESHWPPNVVAHGTLGQGSYESLLAVCTAAVGTLAMHRKNMNEASPLKVREYLALGLPCIIAYDDTDFPEEVPFLLRIPNKPGNALAARHDIAGFLERWTGRRVERSQVDRIDAASKEAARLAFMARAVDTLP